MTISRVRQVQESNEDGENFVAGFAGTSVP
jgi:hypothetical protein